MDLKGKKFKVMADPEDSRENPSFIGKILGETEKGKIKIKTLSTLGLEKTVWINKDDIVNFSEYEQDLVKVDVKEGSDVFIETIRKVKTGNPTGLNPAAGEGTLKLLNPPAPGSPIPAYMQKPPTVQTICPRSYFYSGGGSGGSGDEPSCGNCDWVYSTHCTSCSDRSSSQQCARPFFPYP